MYTWSMLYFQDSNSPNMEFLTFFHDSSFLILILITTLISFISYLLIMNKLTNRFVTNNNLIEIIWTIIPMIVLMFMAMPSLKILYLMEDFSSNYSMTIKAIGHQWYWSYEYSDFLNIEFDSFMITLLNKKNIFRLLDVDNRIITPMQIHIRVLISSIDVIHSFTIPSLGIKLDATPGRINQSSIWMTRPGIFFGQCSEICGMNHSFMPIVIESTKLSMFTKWIKSF